MRYPTVILFAIPRLVLQPELDWKGWDPITFDVSFRWKSDPLGGLLDLVTEPEMTRATRRGDCDDYAAVMASYFLSETDDPVRLLGLRRGWTFHVAVEVAGTIYASDQSYLKTERYLEKSGYHVMFSRTIQ
jgi:hypothetical protein